MDNAPHDFILNHKERDLIRFQDFVHRTFNGKDLENFFTSIRRIYKSGSSLEEVFGGKKFQGDIKERIIHLRNIFIDDNFEKMKHQNESNLIKIVIFFTIILSW